jgi:hypothetical protein
MYECLNLPTLLEASDTLALFQKEREQKFYQLTSGSVLTHHFAAPKDNACVYPSERDANNRF